MADGMFRLHDVKGKLYFEIPDSLFGREMLLGVDHFGGLRTTLRRRPAPSRNPAARGFHATRAPSNCARSTAKTSPTKRGLPQALTAAVKRKPPIPILRNYKIEAWNPDSTAVVVNVTDLFVADVKEMSPFSEYGLYTAFELKKTFRRSVRCWAKSRLSATMWWCAVR